MPHAVDNNIKNTFRKQDRLKSSLEIDALYRENQSVFSYPLKCYYSFSERSENKSAIRIAFAVPKKLFKHAVDRNRLKRRMREAYRLNYKKIFETFVSKQESHLKLFIIFVGKEMMEYGKIEKSIENILAELSNCYSLTLKLASKLDF